MRSFLLISLLILIHVETSLGQWVQDKNLTGGSIMEDIIEFKGDLYLATYTDGIFRSSDNGNSWTHLNMPQNFRIVSMTVHKDQLIGVVYGHTYLSSDGNNWTDLPAPKAFLNQVISDGSNLYIVSRFNGVFKSDDDGTTWEEINNDETASGIYAIAKHNNVLFAGGNSGAFFRSSDEGQVWEKIQLDSQYPVSEIYLRDGNPYITVQEAILKSENNGDDWTNITASDPSIYLTTPMYMDDAAIFLNNNGTIYKSEDDGVTWLPSVQVSPRYNVNCMFADDNSVFLGMWGGGVMQTSRSFTDQWQQLNNGIYLTSIHKIEVYEDSVYIATEFNFVRSSTNNGQTWRQEKNRIDYSGQDARAMTIHGQYIFTGSGGYGVQRRELSNLTWEDASEGLPNKLINALTSNNDYLFVAVDDQGIYRSDDYGATWTHKNEGITSGIRSIYTHNDRIFAGTWDGVFMSKDNGDNWQAISDLSSESILKLDSMLFVATQFDGLQKTSNEGQNWFNSLNKSVFCIANYNKYIFAGCWNGEVLISDDYGTTWKNISNSQIPQDSYVSAINFSGDSIFVGMNQYGKGIWKRALHELIPPTLSFTSENDDLTLREDEPIVLQSDQYLKNADGSELDNQSIASLITVTNQNEEEVKFTVEIDESKKTIYILISDPVDGVTYKVSSGSFGNTSGLITMNQESPEFTFVKNTPPVVIDFSISGFENQELVIQSNQFTDAYEDQEGDEMSSIVIAETPVHGDLYWNSELITDESEIASKDLGNLIYIPENNFTGTDQVSWYAYDGREYSFENAFIHIDVTPITGLEDHLTTQFLTYPNPTSSIVSLNLENEYTGLVKIKVIDFNGRQLVEREYLKLNNSFSQSIDLTYLPGGLYFLHFAIGDLTGISKIIKN